MKINFAFVYFLLCFKAYAICSDSALKEAIMLDEVQLIGSSKCSWTKNASDHNFLHLAIDLNSLNLARYLLESEVEVDGIDDLGRTSLHFVHHIDSAQLLSDFGANFNHVDNNGDTPLLAAMKRGEFDMMRELFHHGSDITANEIAFASKKGHFLALSFLSKNAKSRFIRGSGLYFKDFSFIEARYQKVAKRLISLGADLNASKESLLKPYLDDFLMESSNNNKKTIFSAVHFLVSHGANVTKLTAREKKKLSLYLRQKLK